MAAKKMATGLVVTMAILSAHFAVAYPPKASGSSPSSGPSSSSTPSGSSTATSTHLAMAHPTTASGRSASSGPSSSSTTSTSSSLSTRSASATTTTTTTTTKKDTKTTLGRGHVIPTEIPDVPVGYPLGCWLEGSTPGNTLTEAFFEDEDNMTPHACAHLCRDYLLFGLEYGIQCECGDTITPGSAFPVNNERCQMPCSGNESLSCGGHDTLMIYQQLPPPPPPPSGLFSNISYTSDGCLAEPTDGERALDGFLVADQRVTPAFCAEICGMSNFLFFGVEYGNECWCGNSIAPWAVFIDASECNVPCAGNSSQTCGGKMALSLWNGTYIDRKAGVKVDGQLHSENMTVGNVTADAELVGKGNERGRQLKVDTAVWKAEEGWPME